MASQYGRRLTVGMKQSGMGVEPSGQSDSQEDGGGEWWGDAWLPHQQQQLGLSARGWHSQGTVWRAHLACRDAQELRLTNAQGP